MRRFRPMSSVSSGSWRHPAATPDLGTTPRETAGLPRPERLRA
ncbi:hypothetical protein [Actinomycetospora atypica]|uniref:Uncharacterized protein n=1 Tax=Actinomycetospora atypica TaxID=1290095 RepID=A0ABV9YG39_9PSEU